MSCYQFEIQHTSQKFTNVLCLWRKGGFISNRHDNIRDLLTICLNKVCTDVQVEPHLIPVSNENFKYKSANVSEEARLDIKAKGFWRHGETAFFDVRVTPSKNLKTEQIFRRHEDAKKREYLERVLEVEHGSFTPLIFGTNGGFGEECKRFLSTLANKLSEKNNDTYGTVISNMAKNSTVNGDHLRFITLLKRIAYSIQKL